MDNHWNFENPADLLKQYNEDADLFIKKKEKNKELYAELSEKEKILNEKSKELEKLEAKLKDMSSYAGEDLESMLETNRMNMQEKIDREQKAFEAEKKELLLQRDRQLAENDAQLEKCLEEFRSKHAGEDRELTEAEEKALEFETLRRQFLTDSDNRLNEFQDQIKQEELDFQTSVGAWKQEQDAVLARYEPDIAKYKKEIDAIQRKHQPEIRQYQDLVRKKSADREAEIQQLQRAQEREAALANEEIEQYQKDFKQTDKEYLEQIKRARAQNKPTARMESSRTTRLYSINDQIQKTSSRANRKIAGLREKIDESSRKHAKQIEKAKEQLSAAIQKRDQEMKEPSGIYQQLVRDRDRQMASIQEKIDQREGAYSSRVDCLKEDIAKEKNAQERCNLETDQKITAFVMSGDTCLPDVVNEVNVPFQALEEHLDTWMEMLSVIKKDKLPSAYPAGHEKQKKLLASKSYEELQKEVLSAREFDNKISMFAENSHTWMISSGILGGVGVLLLFVMQIVLKIPVGWMGILIAFLGFGLMAFTIIKTRKEFLQICRYVSLASDYQEFPGISSHSVQLAKDRELEKMKELGRRLYEVRYGKMEAQKFHAAKDADIKADYDRDLKLAVRNFENQKKQIERDGRQKVEKIKDDVRNRADRFYSEKEEIESRAEDLRQQISHTDNELQKMNEMIYANKEFLDSFEDAYKKFEKKLEDRDWKPSIAKTKGILSNDLYLIPEDGSSKDLYGHKKIYKVNHKKKALVILYDIADVEEGGGSRFEQIGNLIRNLMYDLMHAVYRVNSKENYVQFIVDEVVCTHEFKSTKVKNTFNIGEITEKIEDMKGYIKGFRNMRNKLAENGLTIDQINEQKYRSQDRPEVYQLLYLIYKPDEHSSRLNEDIEQLLPDCDKYGFLPVFICGKEAWEQGIREKESMYKDIQSRINNTIIIYDGRKYTKKIYKSI